MKTIEKFERFGQKIYNGQDVLKNHILPTYPIIYTDNTDDLECVKKYIGLHEYVWIVEKNFKTINTFPWHFKPTKHAIYCFPYVNKNSKKIKSWKKVKLVPTEFNDNTEKIWKPYICGIYDIYCGKNKFDIFFTGRLDTGTYNSLIEKFPDVKVVDNFSQAKHLSTTDMFWLVPDDIDITPMFNFSYQPDDWSHKYTHTFLNGLNGKGDGIALFSKAYEPTEKELQYRYYANKKELKILASTPKKYEIYRFKNYSEYQDALINSKTELFYYVPDDVEISKDFDFSIYFSHQERYDRSINHVFLNNTNYDGIVLFSKHSPITKKEFNNRFIVTNKKEWNIIASHPKSFDFFLIDSYNEYLYALEKSTTDLFWMSSININPNQDLIQNFYISHHDTQLRQQTHAFIHQVEDQRLYNGLFLCSKHKELTIHEVECRFPINRIEYDLIGSMSKKYNIIKCNSYDDYLNTISDTNITELFWTYTENVQIDENFNFDLYFTHDNEYDRKQNHTFLHNANKKFFRNGVFLLSKHKTITKKEFENRFIVNGKEWDIIASKEIVYDKFIIETYDDYLQALKNTKTEMFWGLSNNALINSNFKFDIYFTHDNEYDRKQNHAFIHRVNDKDHYNGVFLFSKYKKVSKKEIEHRYLIEKKEWPIVASEAIQYEQFVIDSYKDYLDALDKSKTELFYGISNNVLINSNFKFDIYFTHDNEYDRKQNHAFIHRVNDKDLYNGVFLFSKHKKVSKKEIEHKHLIEKKEWPIVASGPIKYEIFKIETYEDYLYASKNSKTELFYSSSANIDTNEFKFDIYFTHDNEYDRKHNHAFYHLDNNETKYNGLFLLSKYAPVSAKEIYHRHIINHKPWNIIASRYKIYDVVFISYNEPNANENYDYLLQKIPNAKRVNGVRGIHQAHIEAAKQCETEMFWVVDGDARLVDDFSFEYRVEKWNRDMVHVWRSKNPVNDLVYGYGGVKLLPRKMTIEMDTTKPDMTTSISKKFKAVESISNITAFNTDPFNTWKSAFRECVKLSSKIIDRQKDDETSNRLRIWCTIGEHKEYGNYSIAGAKDGAAYGARNMYKSDLLAKINDFDWLQEQFKKSYL